MSATDLINDATGLFKQANPLEAQLWPFQKNQFRSMTSPGGWFGPQKGPVQPGVPHKFKMVPPTGMTQQAPGETGITPGDAWNNTFNRHTRMLALPEGDPQREAYVQSATGPPGTAAVQHPKWKMWEWGVQPLGPLPKGAIRPRYDLPQLMKKHPRFAQQMIDMFNSRLKGEMGGGSWDNTSYYKYRYGPEGERSDQRMLDALFGEGTTPHSRKMYEHRTAGARPPDVDSAVRANNLERGASVPGVPTSVSDGIRPRSKIR